MPSNRQIGDAIEKEVAEVLRAEPRGFKVWKKPAGTRWQSGEIFGIGDLLIYDGSDLIIGQVKKAHGGFPSVEKEFCAEAREVFDYKVGIERRFIDPALSVPTVWFFWVREDGIEWYILEDDYTLSELGRLPRLKID